MSAELGLNRLEDAVAMLQGQNYYLLTDETMQKALSDRQLAQQDQVCFDGRESKLTI